MANSGRSGALSGYLCSKRSHGTIDLPVSPSPTDRSELAAFTMTDTVSSLPAMDDKHSTSDISDEKKGLDGVEVTEDAIMAKEVEEFEERLQNDEATDDEYRVQEAWEVAIKVSRHATDVVRIVGWLLITQYTGLIHS